jgi:cytoskeletal protein RodZ
LDSVVFILDTIVSGLGSWVGILGLKSVRTLDLDDVRKYVRWLGVVAVFSMIMRVLWVFDVVYAVKRAVKESENSANAGSSSSDSSTGVDTGTGSGETIDSKAITAFGIQATIIAMICLFAWSSCFRRAVSFYRAVQWHDIESQTSRQVITVTNSNGGIEPPTASAPSVTTAAPSASARPLPLSASVV